MNAVVLALVNPSQPRRTKLAGESIIGPGQGQARNAARNAPGSRISPEKPQNRTLVCPVFDCIAHMPDANNGAILKIDY